MKIIWVIMGLAIFGCCSAQSNTPDTKPVRYRVRCYLGGMTTISKLAITVNTGEQSGTLWFTTKDGTNFTVTAGTPCIVEKFRDAQ